MSASRQMPQEVVDRIAQSGIIAVLVIDDVQDAVPLARTLADNGIVAMELTLRTDPAIESLRAIRQAVPAMYAGVGTILTPAQVTLAQDNGAAFGVAPGYNRDVVAAASAAGLPFAPGIATPSEIEGALNQGCRILKYFHAEGMGGVDYLKGINAPYKHLGLKYIPLGGVSLANLRQYLAFKDIIAIGGSWIAPQDLIKARDWTAIARNAREASAIFHEVRG